MAVESERKQALQHTESKQLCACSSWIGHGSTREDRILGGMCVTGQMKRMCPRWVMEKLYNRAGSLYLKTIVRKTCFFLPRSLNV